jgi:hypothetical protein
MDQPFDKVEKGRARMREELHAWEASEAGGDGNDNELVERLMDLLS